MGWHFGAGRSLVRTDKGGEDTVLLAEKLLRLVKLQDGTPLQDHHKVCTQDGVNSVLRGQEGLVSVVGGTAEDCRPPPAWRRFMATMPFLPPLSQASFFHVALTDQKLSSQG